MRQSIFWSFPRIAFNTGGIHRATFITKRPHRAGRFMKRREQALLLLAKAARDESLLDAVMNVDTVADDCIWKRGWCFQAYARTSRYGTATFRSFTSIPVPW